MPKKIILPMVTSDFESGTIESWSKNEGDRIEKGEVLLSLETDKAVIDVEAEESGVLGKILVAAGTEDVPVNTVIGLLLEDGESGDLNSFPDSVVEPANEPKSATTEASKVTSSAAADTTLQPNAEGRIFASPLARRIAAEQGIDLSGIKGRGPNRRILKADVEQAAKASDARTQTTQASIGSVAGEGDYTAIANNKMRKTIAKRLGESKRDVPHFYLSVNCELDALLELRKELNANSPEVKGSYKLSINDFIIKACALALRDVPAANSSWTEAAIHQYHDVDVSVAVATDGGLITPIVRRADTKSMVTISNEVKDLAKRARYGKLRPEEFKGGGFSISNMGMYGISQFSAIVNPPQSCILAVGAAEQLAVVKAGEFAVATVITCTLSADHRSVDGVVAAQFLQAFKGYIEQPLNLKLLGGL